MHDSSESMNYAKPILRPAHEFQKFESIEFLFLPWDVLLFNHHGTHPRSKSLEQMRSLVSKSAAWRITLPYRKNWIPQHSMSDTALKKPWYKSINQSTKSPNLGLDMLTTYLPASNALSIGPNYSLRKIFDMCSGTSIRGATVLKHALTRACKQLHHSRSTK
jgi:hypothetical protein